MLERVAAIFRQMMPDLPMPVTMTRPRHSKSSWTARSKSPSSRSTRPRIACRLGLEDLAGELERRWRCRVMPTAPRAMSWIFTSRWSSGSSRSSRSAFCASLFAARWILVDLHEHAVHAGRDAGRRHRLDVLGLAGGDAVPAAGQLQAVGDVVDDGIAERAQHREGAHVDDEVVVAEAEAALGDDDVASCRLPVTFSIACRMSSGARNCPFLMLTTRPVRAAATSRSVCRDRNAGICSTSATSAAGRRLRRLMDVGEDRDLAPLLDARRGSRTPSARPGPRNDSSEVRFALSKDALKTYGTPARRAISLHRQRRLDRVRLALDHAGAGDQQQRTVRRRS